MKYFLLLIIFSFNVYSLPDIRVTGSIDNINIIKTINVLRMAKLNSTINIELRNNPGGLIIKERTLMNILEKYKKWKGLKYHFIIKGYCHSACTSLLMIAKSVTIKNNVPMIFHTIQHCILGKCYPVIKGLGVRNMYRKFGAYYRRILTKEQFRRFQRGEDVLIYGKQFKERF